MRTVVNEDGSVTTLADGDESPRKAEAKVVEPPEEKPAAKTRARAESK